MTLPNDNRTTMKMIVKRRYASQTAAMISLVMASPILSAASGSISDARITQVQSYRSSPFGSNGSYYITLDTRFTLAGVCLYSGNIDAPPNWMLQFDAEHASFKSMYATALTAHSSGRNVQVFYDDGFGSGTTCRIIGLVVDD